VAMMSPMKVWLGEPNVVLTCTDETEPDNPEVVNVTLRGAPGVGPQAVPSGMAPSVAASALKVAAGTASLGVPVILDSADVGLLLAPYSKAMARILTTAAEYRMIREDSLNLRNIKNFFLLRMSYKRRSPSGMRANR